MAVERRGTIPMLEMALELLLHGRLNLGEFSARHKIEPSIVRYRITVIEAVIPVYEDGPDEVVVLESYMMWLKREIGKVEVRDAD